MTRPQELDARGRRLRAALAAVLVRADAPELRLVHRWLDSWSGIGLIVTGMSHTLRHRLPTMTLMGSVGQVGQLIAYGANFGEQVQRVARYVDRILKGAKPGDLPVEQAQRFELVVNMKTARVAACTFCQLAVVL